MAPAATSSKTSLCWVTIREAIYQIVLPKDEEAEVITGECDAPNGHFEKKTAENRAKRLREVVECGVC